MYAERGEGMLSPDRSRRAEYSEYFTHWRRTPTTTNPAAAASPAVIRSAHVSTAIRPLNAADLTSGQVNRLNEYRLRTAPSRGNKVDAVSVKSAALRTGPRLEMSVGRLTSGVSKAECGFSC